MTDDFFANLLADMPVIAILRGHDPDATVHLAQRCWDAGISLVEVPVQGPRGLDALHATAQAAARRNALVGAGTVYTIEGARKACDAGASFLVAPGFSTDVVRFAQDEGIAYLPGVTTPTEIQQAVAHGVGTLKLFPAGALGTTWIRALHGPFPEINLIAVGGVNAANAADFLAAGAIGVGVGGALQHGSTIEELARLALRGSTRTPGE